VESDGTGDIGSFDDTLSLRPASRSVGPEQQIGSYRLLQMIGEGGMGEVWLAEQWSPVRRRVAIKLIKAGMDTREVVARFEAERQALAVMDHPAIAKVFDGGSTPEGRPYFVMEYVPGLPLTQHCDRHRLSTVERLELFVGVCEGVQHAHQRALIHRDLKPTNVLVTDLDGKARTKIIDFGIAKAVVSPLTEKTLFTVAGVLIGTPEYMSPEQADPTPKGVDTRTDIYSLGVILYELLSGQLPFDSTQLRSLSYEELRRRLRDVDPPRPSTRLSALGLAAEQISERRQTNPEALRKRLEGDLDAIVMKALEKDPARRYGTASELAADIQRHIRDEPVLARPPSRTYKIRKYARRHALLLLGAGAVAASIAVGGVVATVALVQARRARAEEARQRALAEARLHAAEGYADKLFSDVAPRMTPLPGSTELRKRFISQSSDFLEQLGVGLNDEPRLRWLTARLEFALASLEANDINGTSLGHYTDAIKHAEHVQALLGSLPVGFPSPLERSLLAVQAEDLLVIATSGELQLQHIERMRSLAEAIPSQPEREKWVELALGRKGDCLRLMGRYAEAIPIWKAKLERYDAQNEKNPGQRSTLFGQLVAHSELSMSLAELDDLAGATEHAEMSFKLAKKMLDPNDVRLVLEDARTSVELGGLYLLGRRFSAGEKLIDAGLERFSWLMGRDPSNEVAWMHNAKALSVVGHRAFSAAQLTGVPKGEQLRLLSRAVGWWNRCRQFQEERPRATSPAKPGYGAFDCGGHNAESAQQMLEAAK
jgi:serine/threonine protein kinase